MLKRFKDLTEKEILAIAIANEEEDGRIYGEFADALRESYPALASGSAIAFLPSVAKTFADFCNAGRCG